MYSGKHKRSRREELLSSEQEALRQAINKKDYVVALRLLKGGVKPADRFIHDSNSLFSAIEEGPTSVVKTMLQNGGDVNASNGRGVTPLHVACRAQRQEMVEVLVERGSYVNAPTTSGRTPLHTALWWAAADIALHLVHHGASVNRPDGDGWTPLHWVAREGGKLTLVLEPLLERGARLNERTNLGSTPLHISLKEGNWELAKKLVEEGASVNRPDGKRSMLSLLLGISDKKVAEELLSDFFRAGLDPHAEGEEREISTLVKSLKSDQSLLKVVDERMAQIPSLQWMCVWEIRSQLRYCSGDTYLRPAIQRLVLPSKVKSSLMLKNVLTATCDV